MEDEKIVDLYWERSESAIAETVKKYGRYCHYIAFNILHSEEDSKECVNDTYLAAWNAMPDARPTKLSAFLGRITRNLALKRLEISGAEKRGGGQVTLALDELSECIPAKSTDGQDVDEIALRDALNRFLGSMPKEKRMIFMRRYWYLCPVSNIAKDFSMSESKVKMMLLRARNELKTILEKEGFDL